MLRVGLVALALATAVPAAAKPAMMVNLWQAGPVEAQAPGPVARDEVVFTQRLLPTGLVTVDADVLDAAGKMLFPAGTEFFELAGEAHRGWCDTAPIGVRGVPPVRRLAPVHRCLLDEGLDNSADSYFELAGTSWGLPSVFARLPKKLATIAPVALRTLEPAAGRDRYALQIVYHGIRPITGRPMFTARAGSPGFEQTALKSADWNGAGDTIDLAGTSVSVSAADKQAAQVTAVVTLPEGQAFSGVQGLEVTQ